MFSDQELARYSRQLLLPEVDLDGQERLKQARVCIVGAGGLGHPVALYLAAAGVGQLLLVDDDAVEISNLTRQIGFITAQVGEPKVVALAATLGALNPFCRVATLPRRLTEVTLNQLENLDLLLDCTDNFPTRFLLNRFCVAQRLPLISGASIRLTGQVAGFDLRQADAACYRCLFGEGEETGLRCAEAGVLGPLVGMIGSFQALLALRFLVTDALPNTVWTFEADDYGWQRFELKKDPRCPVCHAESVRR